MGRPNRFRRETRADAREDRGVISLAAGLAAAPGIIDEGFHFREPFSFGARAFVRARAPTNKGGDEAGNGGDDGGDGNGGDRWWFIFG